MSDSNAVRPGTNIRMIWAIIRLVTAALIATAVVTQFVNTYTVTAEKGRDVETTLVNFFSYFTILSNCLGAITMLIGGIWLLTRGGRKQFEPRWTSYLWVSVGTYMVITGIVYNLLLRGYVLEQGATVEWANEVLHLVAPIVFFADLILNIARRPLRWTGMGIASIFPIVWVIYTLIRAENVTNPVTGAPYWYPYPFLSPYLQPNGYFGVALYIVGIAAAILTIAALAVWRTRVTRHAVVAEPVVAEPVVAESEMAEIPAPEAEIAPEAEPELTPEAEPELTPEDGHETPEPSSDDVPEPPTDEEPEPITDEEPDPTTNEVPEPTTDEVPEPEGAAVTKNEP